MADVTIGYTNPLSWLLIVAKELNFFKDNGVNADFRIFLTGRKGKDALHKGWVDIAHIIEVNIAELAMERKQKIKLLGNVQTRTDGAILARKDSGIKTPKDIEGKTLAWMPRTTSDMFVYSYAAKHGIDLDKVNIVPTRVDHMQKDLLSGKVDAASMWEPYTTNIRIASSIAEIDLNLLPNDCNYKFYVALGVLDKFLKKHPERVQKVIDIIKLAEDFTQNNWDEARGIIIKSIGVEPKMFDLVADKESLKFQPFEDNFWAQIEQKIDLIGGDKAELYKKNIDNMKTNL